MWLFALKELLRHRMRSALVVGGLAIPVAMLVILRAFGASYEQSLRSELDQMGVQLMVVPIGCPYDAAARVVKGHSLDDTLPSAALTQVISDPAVAVAAPMLIVSVPRPNEKRVDLWMGIDEVARAVKPWWKAGSGKDWFTRTNGVILGSEAAEIEMRSVGDKLFVPEGNQSLYVEGILERSGTGDDNLFFVPLQTAQSMFRYEGKLTAIAVRLHEPELLPDAGKRLGEIPGAQVATFTEMTGVFLNMVGSVRILLQSISVLSISICLLGVFNTVLAAVLERTGELAVMRAIGASRTQVFSLITAESVLLASTSAILGCSLAAGLGGPLEKLIRPLLPLAPAGRLWHLSAISIFEALAVCLAAGALAGLYPAWKATRIQPAQALKPD
jgi:putative ABC transport system permease protein